MKALTICQPWAYLIVHGQARLFPGSRRNAYD